jgi:K+-transporting ATPase ATPase C chain
MRASRITLLLACMRPACVLLAVFTLLLGFAYPALVAGFAQALFPHEASGSLVERDGKIVGSTQLAQHFEGKRYFWPRPSATTPPYNAAGSGGSNLSPANPKLVEAVKTRIERLQKADPEHIDNIPVELLTASASGLDPHISPDAAYYQMRRIASARKMTPEEVRALVDAHIEAPQLGVLGKPRVNVLKLNMALDAMK